MKKLLLLIPFVFVTPVSAQEVYTINANKLCAAIVNIPYASDNFSDLEWQQFVDCLNYVRQFRE